MPAKFYVTTPIYYVNAPPHIGHSYTTIAADTLARFMRRRIGKENVWFLTGTDEHWQKIQRAADEAGLPAQEFVDRIVPQFQELWNKLGLSYDDFIRTTQERHIRCVRRALGILKEKGDIYEAPYQGLYCTPCETFCPQAQTGALVCPDCHRPLEKISETNFFFRLSHYQQWLIEYIEQNPGFILPQIRRNEVLSFLKLNALADLCISRPKERLSWGIGLPFSAGHVTYVWLDALINYISAVGEFDSSGAYQSRWWGQDTAVLHLIGKDILRQHAVYWPVILRALGIKFPGQFTVFAHGWWMVQDAKMSKSRGNVVAPLTMADKYGIDAYRYFLLRDVPFGMDGNFSEEAMVKRFNADLANDLGNLLYRTLTMLEKYYAGKVPSGGELDALGSKINQAAACLAQEAGQFLERSGGFNFSAALERIWLLINAANKYVEERKPWELAKGGRPEELKGFIRLLAEVNRKVDEEVAPFMPRTAEGMLAQIGGDAIKKASPLFPRIERSEP